MSYIFGDGFDCYAAAADAIAGYWDSGTVVFTLVTGRFTGSQALQFNTGPNLIIVKSSGANDAVHHIVVAYRQTAALSGTTLGTYLQLVDGTTNQCCIVFRSDGTLLLTSATPAGTVLATYTGAVTAANTWFAFEFEVIISATVGRFRARKNGNTVDDFDSGATLNTRPGTNAYANKLQVGQNTTLSSTQIDDLLWRSDASSVPWVGDVRCYTRMPSTNVSAQFSASSVPAVPSSTANQSTTVKAANAALMSPFVATYDGLVVSAAINISAGGTGNLKAAIYDVTRTTPLSTSNALVNPSTGNNIVTFPTPLAVTKGTTYHLAVNQDFSSITYNTSLTGGWQFTTTYASFPAASPTLTTGAGCVFQVTVTPTNNSQLVNEAQQDGTASYVYDSNVNDADFYSIAALSSTPASVVAVTTRGFMEKSDAGTRTGTVQLKSGATTVAAPTVSSGTSFGWAWRTDVVDPNTSAAWTPANVNSVQIGPIVVS